MTGGSGGGRASCVMRASCMVPRSGSNLLTLVSNCEDGLTMRSNSIKDAVEIFACMGFAVTVAVLGNRRASVLTGAADELGIGGNANKLMSVRSLRVFWGTSGLGTKSDMSSWISLSCLS